MDILEKFQRGQQLHTYQRIDESYETNFFLGYNDKGQMSLVLTEKGNESRVKSSKLIDVQIKRREDEKIVLSFDLLDNSYSSMFMVFCKDMILVCEKLGRSQSIMNAITRWNYWLRMFGKKKATLLDKNEIKGLMGELIQLRDFLIPLYGVHDAIQSWMGPLMGHKDFEIAETWYEVKATTSASQIVSINSLEQLDSRMAGHLLIVRLDECSSVTANAENLNKLVLDIINMIEIPDDLESFRIKLDNAGYVNSEEYDSVCFLYFGTQKYLVDDRFPKIVRKNVRDEINTVQYSLLISGLSQYMEE